MGVDAESPHELLDVAAVVVCHAPIGPERDPPERPLEMTDRRHRHRVDHLLVKLWVGLGWPEPTLGEQVRVVELNGMVEDAARRVEIDHLDVLPHRPRCKLLPGNLDDDLVEGRRIEADGETWIESQDPQPANHGSGDPGGLQIALQDGHTAASGGYGTALSPSVSSM
jgi:hypothetical protein